MESGTMEWASAMAEVSEWAVGLEMAEVSEWAADLDMTEASEKVEKAEWDMEVSVVKAAVAACTIAAAEEDFNFIK